MKTDGQANIRKVHADTLKILNAACMWYTSTHLCASRLQPGKHTQLAADAYCMYFLSTTQDYMRKQHHTPTLAAALPCGGQRDNTTYASAEISTSSSPHTWLHTMRYDKSYARDTMRQGASRPAANRLLAA